MYLEVNYKEETEQPNYIDMRNSVVILGIVLVFMIGIYIYVEVVLYRNKTKKEI